MLVDCHVNVFDDNQVLPLFRDLSTITRPGGIGLRSDADTLARELAKVDKAIIFSLRYKDSIGIDGDDEVTARAVVKYPDRFVGFACIDPRMPDCMDLLIHAIEDLQLKGVKFGPIYNGVSLLDPRMESVYVYLEKNNLPLTMHMGTTFSANAPIEYGRPLDVDTVARRHPGLKMILAHMGHPWYEECIAVIRKQPNVYGEISGLSYRPWQYYSILVAAEEYAITDRDKLFWGTDFPFTKVDEAVEGLRNINKPVEGTGMPRVSNETIERILNSNPFAHWWHGGLTV